MSLTKLDLASFDEVNKTARRRGDKVYAPLNLPAQKKKKGRIKKTPITYLLQCTSASRPDASKMALDALAHGSRANGSRQVWTRDETRQVWTRDDRHH